MGPEADENVLWDDLDQPELNVMLQMSVGDEGVEVNGGEEGVVAGEGEEDAHVPAGVVRRKKVVNAVKWSRKMIDRMMEIVQQLDTEEELTRMGLRKPGFFEKALDRWKSEDIVWAELPIDARKFKARYQSEVQSKKRQEDMKRIIETMKTRNNEDEDEIDIEIEQEIDRMLQEQRLKVEIIRRVKEDLKEEKEREKCKKPSLIPNAKECRKYSKIAKEVYEAIGTEPEFGYINKLRLLNSIIYVIEETYVKHSKENNKIRKIQQKIEEKLEIMKKLKQIRSLVYKLEFRVKNKKKWLNIRQEIDEINEGKYAVRWGRMTSLVNIVSYRLKLVYTMRNLGKKINKLVNEKTKTSQNAQFDSNRAAFFRRFTVNDAPKDQNVTVEFWKEIWEVTEEFRVKSWMERCYTQNGSKIRLRNVESNLTSNRIYKLMIKRKNWSSPGPDFIHNFWIKRLVSLHEIFAEEFNNIFTKNYVFPEEMINGVTYMLFKSGENEDKNYRPITCLNTFYKMYSGVLHSFITEFCNKNELITTNQRGGKERIWGTVETLVIDDAVYRDYELRKDRTKELGVLYTYVRKAFDTVSHLWIEWALKIHHVPVWLSMQILYLRDRWKTRILINGELSEEINFRRGIYQGDTLAPFLFVLCLNPVSMTLNKINSGYKMMSGVRINHFLFIDDLKLFVSANRSMIGIAEELNGLVNDIGLKFGAGKSGEFRKKGGKLVKYPRITVDGDEVTQVNKDNPYKYLGVMQDENGTKVAKFKEDTLDEYIRRVKWIFGTTKLTANRRVQAYNSFCVSLYSYPSWMEFLKIDFDKIRSVLRNELMKHKFIQRGFTGSLLFMPRKLGGRGFLDVEELVNKLKVKIAARIAWVNAEEEIKMVSEFHNNKLKKKSMFRLANAAAHKLDLKLEFRIAAGGVTTFYDDGKLIIDTWDIFQDKYWLDRQEQLSLEKIEEVKKLGWQGKNFVDALGNQHPYDWLKFHRNLTMADESRMFEIISQTAPTKDVLKLVGRHSGDTLCRFCKAPDSYECIEHIMAGCKARTWTKYLVRHDYVLSVFWWYFLDKKEVFKNKNPWFLFEKPQVEMKKEGIMDCYWNVWWPLADEFVDEGAEVHNRPDMVVIDYLNFKIWIIDMCIPWDKNIQKNEEEKFERYQPLKRWFEFAHRGFQAEVLAFVIGVCGSTNVLGEQIDKILPGDKKIYRDMVKATVKATVNEYSEFKNGHIAERGDLDIILNTALNSISGFHSLQRVGGNLVISENYLLPTLSGLNSLQHVGGSLWVMWNEILNTLSPLSSIKSIGGNLHIEANNLDCNSVCTKNLIHYFRNISSDVGMDECNVDNFTCPNNSSNVSDQLNTCIYNQECQICNEIGCNFETIIKRCGDGILDSENGEECDTLINTTVCNYGETTCQLCNSSICKNFTSTGSYCGDSENGEQCDGNQTNICFANCTLMLVPQSTTIPTNTETEPFSGTEATSISGSTSDPTKMSVTKVTNTNGFDCDLYSCTISENEDIKIFTVEQLDANSNLVILNNQELIVSYGNLTLNGFNLSLSSTSVIKIETGCLDAQNSTLNLDLTDVEITPKQKEFELIQYECITNKFKKLATASNSGQCLAVEEVYGASHYSVLISQDSYCVSDSFRFTIYQSFYLIMFVLMIVC